MGENKWKNEKRKVKRTQKGREGFPLDAALWVALLLV